jgi:hypothetical protein
LAKFQNDLNIPLAGLRGADNLSGVGAISVIGMYWSSSPQEPTTPNNYSLNLLFNSFQVQLYYMGNRRHNAMSIRCFKD